MQRRLGPCSALRTRVRGSRAEGQGATSQAVPSASPCVSARDSAVVALMDDLPELCADPPEVAGSVVSVALALEPVVQVAAHKQQNHPHDGDSQTTAMWRSVRSSRAQADARSEVETTDQLPDRSIELQASTKPVLLLATW